MTEEEDADRDDRDYLIAVGAPKPKSGREVVIQVALAVAAVILLAILLYVM